MKKIIILMCCQLVFLQNAAAQVVKTTGNATMTVQSGAVFYVEGGIDVAANTQITNNGTITMTNSGTLTNAGTIAGSGTVTGGLVNSSGTVAPTGCITFGNGFTNSGTIQIDLGGTSACSQHDKISVTGTATLGGTLTVTLANGFTGAAGDQATFLTGSAVSGTFSTTNLPSAWEALYDAPSSGNVTLSYNVLLPAELLNFKGKPQPTANWLTWETGSETQMKGFEIERLEGNSWIKIGFVAAKGNSSQYEFADAPPPVSMRFYRLRMVNLNEKATFSPVISIDRTPKSFVKIYPNPVQGTLNVETNREGETFQIINLMGQIVLSGQLTPQIDVSHLAAGTYLFRIGLEQVKLVVH